MDGTIHPIIQFIKFKGEKIFSEISPDSPRIDLSNISIPNSPMKKRNYNINIAIGM